MTPVDRDFVVKNGAIVRGDSAVTSSTGQVNALQVLGGAAISKNLIVGTTATIYGDTGLQGSLTVGTSTSSQVVPALYSNNVVLASYTSEIVSTSTATVVNLDQFDSGIYRTARYTVQVVDDPSIHITEITLFHNGVDVYKNEYGISTNNGRLGTFDATITNQTVVLNFNTELANAMQIKVVRMGISA